MNNIATRLKRLGIVGEWLTEDPAFTKLLRTLLSDLERGAGSAEPAAPPRLPEPAASPVLYPLNGTKKRPHIGFKGQVLRYLYTGSSDLNNLRHVLKMQRRSFTKNLGNVMRPREGKPASVFVDKHNNIFLTEHGKAEAEWYVRNPNLMVRANNPVGREEED